MDSGANLIITVLVGASVVVAVVAAIAGTATLAVVISDRLGRALRRSEDS